MIDEDKSESQEVGREPTSLSELLDSEAKERARLANKPDISHLPDAVERDDLGRYILLARPGEKLIIERYATILDGKPWLDTKSYTVNSIDEASGRVHLWDDELQRMAMADYIKGPKAGHVFKLPTARTVISSKKKRGRPKKFNPVEKPVAPTSSEPKRRGRPKGSKNRAKEDIMAEKAEARAVKAMKKGAKKQ